MALHPGYRPRLEAIEPRRLLATFPGNLIAPMEALPGPGVSDVSRASTADLGLAFSSEKPYVLTGEEFTITATVTNHGPNPAIHVAYALGFEPDLADIPKVLDVTTSWGRTEPGQKLMGGTIDEIGVGESVTIAVRCIYPPVTNQNPMIGYFLAMYGFLPEDQGGPLDWHFTEINLDINPYRLNIGLEDPPPFELGQPITIHGTVSNLGPGESPETFLGFPSLDWRYRVVSVSAGGKELPIDERPDGPTVPLGRLAGGQSIAVSIVMIATGVGSQDLTATLNFGGRASARLSIYGLGMMLHPPASLVFGRRTSIPALFVSIGHVNALDAYVRFPGDDPGYRVLSVEMGGKPLPVTDTPDGPVFKLGPLAGGHAVELSIVVEATKVGRRVMIADVGDLGRTFRSRRAAAWLTIEDTSRRVTDLGLIEPTRRRPGGLSLAYDGVLDATKAADLTRYSVTLAGPDRKFGTRDDRAVMLARAEYDAASRTVRLEPLRPLARGHFYRVVVADEAHVVDRFDGSVAVGHRLRYRDADGDRIKIASRGGLVELWREASGDARKLRVLPRHRRDVLAGRVHPGKPGGNGLTPRPEIDGASAVRIRLPEAFLADAQGTAGRGLPRDTGKTSA